MSKRPVWNFVRSVASGWVGRRTKKSKPRPPRRIRRVGLGHGGVYAADRIPGGRDLIRAQRIPDDQVAVAFEGGPVLSRHRHGRIGASSCS
jgi:hypothetical protein